MIYIIILYMVLLIVYINLSLYNCILYWLVKQLICYYIIYLLYVIVYSLVISYLFIYIKCINIIYIYISYYVFNIDVKY